jgi:hypothetical protein
MEKKVKETPADQPAEQRPRWSRPTMKFVGNVGEVFLSGGGKISTTTYDSGDTPFKPPGQH